MRNERLWGRSPWLKSDKVEVVTDIHCYGVGATCNDSLP